MYILNITRAMKKMCVIEIRDSIFENYCKRIRFFKENNCCSMKCLEKRFIVASKQINRKST